MSSLYHETLERQLIVTFGSLDQVPPDLSGILSQVDATYRLAEEERERLQQALERAPAMLETRNRIAGNLVRTQNKLGQIIEELPFLVALRTGEHFALLNRAGVRLLGFREADEVIGRSVFDFVHPEDLPRARERMMRVEDAKAVFGSEECRFIRQDGEVVVLELTARTAVQFEGSAATLLVGIDVTERNQMQSQLIHSERMASVGGLAAGVAHEINNPLSFVLSNLTFIASSLEDLAPAGENTVAECMEALEDALVGVRRVREIVRDLKVFSRADEEALSVVDIHASLDCAAKLASHEIRYRAELIKNYAKTPNVLGSEAQLGQVFLNLLMNAAQAIPVGAAHEHRIALSTRETETGEVVVEVSDTGVGISADILPRIFEPFFTTKPVGQGTGLGLSVCHGIVAKLGGRIEVDSAPGKGSTFRVFLRSLLAEAPVGSIVISPSGEQVSRRRTHLLVVDDEPSEGRAVRRLLGPDYEVDIATSGKQALEMLKANPGIELVLCDLMMPEMTGMEFYGVLQERFPVQSERAIFMTGGVFTPNAIWFLNQVRNGRLVKPFDGPTLRALIAESLAKVDVPKTKPRPIVQIKAKSAPSHHPANRVG